MVGNQAWATAMFGLVRINEQQYQRNNRPPEGWILHSSDKGVNWEVQKKILDWSPIKMRFKNEREGYVIGDNAIFVTFDGGINWYINTYTPIKRIFGAQIKDEYNHIVIYSYEYIGTMRHEVQYESFDAGKSWKKSGPQMISPQE
jgi:photosystem II stability/assembly factor-like uncharacterized protein